MYYFILRGTEPSKGHCSDCAHLKGAVSLWCTNDEAKDHYNTAIPAQKNCPFWAPALVYENLSWWEKLKANLSDSAIILDKEDEFYESS